MLEKGKPITLLNQPNQISQKEKSFTYHVAINFHFPHSQAQSLRAVLPASLQGCTTTTKQSFGKVWVSFGPSLGISH